MAVVAHTQTDQQQSSDRGVIFGKRLRAAGTLGPPGFNAPPQGVAGSRVLVLDPADGRTIASAVTSEDGSYRIELAPGTYVVESGDTQQTVKIRAGQQLQLNFAVPTQ